MSAGAFMFKPGLTLSAMSLLMLVLCSCGGGAGSGSGSGASSDPPPPAGSGLARSGVNHLIIVVMQNASFDHLFGTYGAGNGLNPSAPSYRQKTASGSTVQPQLLTDLSPADLNHTRTSYLAAYDSGKMDQY